MAEQEGHHHHEELVDGVEEVQEEELMEQFQTADGGTIVLSSEQLAQMQGIGVGEQAYNVEEIIGGGGGDEEEGEVVGGVHHGHEEEMETQQIHLDANGNAHIVTQGQMGDLVTFHAVGMDEQGNYIGGGGEEGEGEEVGVGDIGGHHVGIPLDQSGMEVGMMEADNVVEEVIPNNNEDGTQYLEEGESIGIDQQEYIEQVFNPETGTFSQVKRPVVQKIQHQQQVKYVLQQSTADGGSQQIVLDENSLQGLIQGGTLTVDSSTGKQIILAPPSTSQQVTQSQSPTKAKIITTAGGGATVVASTSSAGNRSPMKILPAPHPLGDQQQGGKKIIYLQGNQLQGLGGLGETKFITTGSGNQLQLVRVISKGGTGSPGKFTIASNSLKSRPPLAPKPEPGSTIILPSSSGGSGNVVMLPSSYLLQKDQALRSSENSGSNYSESSMLGGLGGGLASSGNLDSFRSLLEPNGMRPRKPCNCTKSQCLKLYCDCFANGEFCHLCNCTNCYNNLQHEEDRQKAIKLVLERNPGAFRPKIGKSSMTGEAHERRHNKGCNCRRSGCLKNYCECYEAKIFCSGICKCTGCKNCIENIPSGLPNGVGVEQHFAGAGTAHRQTLKDLAEAAEVRVQQQNQVKNKMRAQMQDVSPQNNLGIMVPPIVFRYPSGSISYEVITSIVELLLSRAEAAEKMKLSEGEVERIILEEFSDCLASIMDLGTSIDRHWP